MSSNLYRPPAKTKATILVCACGNKYIKTRANQRDCIRCIGGRNRGKTAR